MADEGKQPERPRAWATALVAAVVLVVLAIACLTLAVYEYSRWQAPIPNGIRQDYSPDTYMAIMIIFGAAGLLALGGLYVIGSRWWKDSRESAP